MSLIVLDRNIHISSTVIMIEHNQYTCSILIASAHTHTHMDHQFIRYVGDNFGLLVLGTKLSLALNLTPS